MSIFGVGIIEAKLLVHQLSGSVTIIMYHIWKYYKPYNSPDKTIGNTWPFRNE